MATYLMPKAQVRPQLDQNKDRIYGDWTPQKKLTYEQMEKMLVAAKEDLLKIEEIKSELSRVKKDLETQKWRNSRLAKEVNDANKKIELLSKVPTKEMLLRAASAIPKPEVEVIKRDKRKWK